MRQILAQSGTGDSKQIVRIGIFSQRPSSNHVYVYCQSISKSNRIQLDIFPLFNTMSELGPLDCLPEKHMIDLVTYSSCILPA